MSATASPSVTLVCDIVVDTWAVFVSDGVDGDGENDGVDEYRDDGVNDGVSEELGVNDGVTDGDGVYDCMSEECFCL